MRDSLRERIVVCDGAMGTMLHSAGVRLDRSPSELNLTQPELVRDLHAAYVAAGAALLQTNTFDANRLRLGQSGMADQIVEINIAGARLAREAARDSVSPVLVAGSVGPVLSTSDAGHLADAQRSSLLAEQIAALANWVDLIILETFGDLASLVQAVEVATAESDRPIIAQMTFSTDGRTLRGEDPHTVATVLSESAVVAIGANCTVGPEALLEVVAELAAHTSLPVSVQPNAGMPHRLGHQLRYAYNTDSFADAAVAFVGAGATLVGGCCGTTPAHIRAVTDAMADVQPSSRSAPTGQQVPTDPARVGTPADAVPPVRWPRSEEFVVIAGLHAPRGQDLAEFIAQGERLVASGVDMLAVTHPDPPAARVNPIAAAVLLRERIGSDVILSIETSDRTLAALQADLLGAHALGINVVVCRTGTPRVAGSYPDPGSLWDVDSVRLVRALAGLNTGVDWRGITAPERTRFVIGATAHSSVEDLDHALQSAEDRVRAGAHFLLTDPIVHVAETERVLSLLTQRVDVPVIAVLGSNAQMETIEKLRHMVAGVLLPTTTVGDDRTIELITALRRGRGPT
ncbi:MAG: homocysteine S-methyltransferase family protein [Euzebya sp.]